MMRRLRRILCFVLGHSDDTELIWGAILVQPGQGLDREVAEVCCRCSGVIRVSTLRLEDGRWTA